MIVRFMLDGIVRGGSYSKENGIISRGEVLRLDEVFLLPPCQPTKIVCVGLNYTKHAEELKMPLPEEPIPLLEAPFLHPWTRTGISSILLPAARWTTKASWL